MCIFRWKILLLLIVNICLLAVLEAKKIDNKSLIEIITDAKEFKKLLRTKTNVLILFTKSTKEAGDLVKLFTDVAEETKGYATLAYIDCGGDGKKLCKKLKVFPAPAIFKHYKDGEFHKDYDRKLVLQSMVNFLKDPSGDAPWEEDDTAQDVVHIQDASGLKKLLQKEKMAIMIMFYAPWCGFCKRLKPEYASAATELKGHSVMAAMDVNKPENSNIRRHFNITGFPTLLYFENGMLKYKYEGENNKEGIIAFMKNPGQQPQKPKEPEWADVPSEVVHLTDQTFDSLLQKESSVLVMFYAPWCGHCKKMKPEYVDAAAKLKQQKVPGVLAAVDATREKSLAERFKITGYPSVKYFKNGEFAFDVNLRTADKIEEFMKDPKEPPPPPPPEVPWHEIPSDVVHLDEENFKVILKRKKHALVMFYAPWCGHCKKAKPEFQSAASAFKDDPRVVFAAIDCTAYSAVCTAHDVKGYPTFIYFSYFKTSKPYNGGRSEAEFVAFMKENQETQSIPTQPVSEEVQTSTQTPMPSSQDIPATTTTTEAPQTTSTMSTPPASMQAPPPTAAPVTAKPTTTLPPPPPPPPKDSWAGIPGSEYIKSLSKNSFDSTVSSTTSLLTLFCDDSKECKALKEVYGAAAAKLHNEKVPGLLAAVDTKVEKELATQFNVKRVPELKFFRNGKYEGDFSPKSKVEDILLIMKNVPVQKEEL